MREFLDENFLLSNATGVKLYHEYVADLPIIDYHNHLSPQDIASDKTFANISDLWLAGDHYKWRAMRANGITERLISGDASPWEKFEAWAKTVPNTLRNPLYHWTHLELQRYFGIKTLLGPDTARQIYDQCNEMLQSPDFSARSLLKQMRVEKLCTTDHPNDDLLSHKALATQHEVSVRPTFRPDQFLGLQHQDEFVKQVAQLETTAGVSIATFDQLVAALELRIGYFNDLGSVSADHGLSELDFIEVNSVNIDEILSKALAKQELSKQEIGAFQSGLLLALSEAYHKLGWVQQYHLGPLRNNNSLLMQRIGSDAGADSIGDHRWAKPLSKLLDAMNSNGHLGKTILYNLNPADNAVFATMAGNFNSEETPGKVQYGAAWWFLDQKNGIEQNLNDISNFGLLHHFVGMLTDSRSFLSFPRHEYFRRILCNTIGQEVEQGLLPSDDSLLKTLVSNVAYDNAKNYFKWV